jgi:hypothetical protein
MARGVRLQPRENRGCNRRFNQAYAAAKRGEIPTIRIGRSLRVPKPAFDRLLEG